MYNQDIFVCLFVWEVALFVIKQIADKIKAEDKKNARSELGWKEEYLDIQVKLEYRGNTCWMDVVMLVWLFDN